MLYEHSHTATLYSQFSGVALKTGTTGSLQNGTGGSPAPELLALYIRIEWLSLAGVCNPIETIFGSTTVGNDKDRKQASDPIANDGQIEPPVPVAQSHFPVF